MKPVKSLGAFSLAMMNIAIVGSVQLITASSTYGLPVVFFYLIAALVFFIPCILVTKELAIRYPTIGGVFIWVEHALGKKMGFFTVCILWLANLIWYPTIFSFIVAGIAYLFKPELADSKVYMVSGVLILFWAITFLNCFGIRVSSLISTLGSLFGILLPMFLLLIMGLVWYVKGGQSNVQFTKEQFLPNFSHFANWAFLIQIIISLSGIEMSAVHAGDVRNPKKDFPRSLLYSGCAIFIILISASLSIAMVLPSKEISLVSGVFNAFKQYLGDFGLAYLLPLIGSFVILGNFGNVSSWMISSTRAMHVACQHCHLPHYFQATNRYEAPVGILILEAILFSIICLVFLLLPSVNASYWTLLDLASQVALLYYILIFTSAILLRWRLKHKKYAINFPAIVGGLAAAGAIFVGFLPPESIGMGSAMIYRLVLGLGILLAVLIPIVLLQFSHKEK
ncbi:MAG: amino acid permease [Parachlamydiales bacterium]|nr:amino acid permease [Parachlamydiales bacterium]